MTGPKAERDTPRDRFAWGPLLWTVVCWSLLVLDEKVLYIDSLLVLIGLSAAAFVVCLVYAVKALRHTWGGRLRGAVSACLAVTVAVLFYVYRFPIFTAADAAKVWIQPARFAQCAASAREWEHGAFFAVCDRNDLDAVRRIDIIAYDTTDQILEKDPSPDWRDAIGRINPFDQFAFDAQDIGNHYFSVQLSYDSRSELSQPPQQRPR